VANHNQGGAMNPEIEQDLVAEDLIEEVSIDGMCGVY
jgi:mycofactocin precursor